MKNFSAIFEVKAIDNNMVTVTYSNNVIVIYQLKKGFKIYDSLGNYVTTRYIAVGDSYRALITDAVIQNLQFQELVSATNRAVKKPHDCNGEVCEDQGCPNHYADKPNWDLMNSPFDYNHAVVRLCMPPENAPQISEGYIWVYHSEKGMKVTVLKKDLHPVSDSTRDEFPPSKSIVMTVPIDWNKPPVNTKCLYTWFHSKSSRESKTPKHECVILGYHGSLVWLGSKAVTGDAITLSLSNVQFAPRPTAAELKVKAEIEHQEKLISQACLIINDSVRCNDANINIDCSVAQKTVIETMIKNGYRKILTTDLEHLKSCRFLDKHSMFERLK